MVRHCESIFIGCLVVVVGEGFHGRYDHDYSFTVFYPFLNIPSRQYSLLFIGYLASCRFPEAQFEGRLHWDRAPLQQPGTDRSEDTFSKG